jgi:hypothetical protein
LVQSIDIEVVDASISTAEAVVAAILLLDTDDFFDDSGDEVVLELAQGSEVRVEADPTLAVTSPSLPPTIIEEGTDRVVIIVDPALFGAHAVVETTVTTSELASAAIPVAVRGLPNGHESQKVTYPAGRLIFKVGPAPASTAGEYDIVVDIEDSNGRTPSSALTFQVYVSDETAPVLDSDDADDALSLANNAAADTTILDGVSQTPLLWELVSAATQTTGADDISEIIELDDQGDFAISTGISTCELIIDPVSAAINPNGVYDIVVRATDGLGLFDEYTLELTITAP